jgi:hypothetical protein
MRSAKEPMREAVRRAGASRDGQRCDPARRAGGPGGKLRDGEQSALFDKAASGAKTGVIDKPNG